MAVEGVLRSLKGFCALMAFADRVRGESLDEMIADAKGLLEAMPKPDPKKTVVNPTNPGQGAGQGETDDQRRKRLFG